MRRARDTPHVKPEYLPQATVVRTEARRPVERSRSYSRAAQRATRAAAAPALGGWGTYATIIAFGLAVCLTGYLAIGDGERASQFGRAAANSAMPLETSPAAKARVARTRDDASALAEASHNAVVEEHLAILESLTIPPRAIPDRRTGRESRGAKDAKAAASAADARNAGGERPPAAVAPMQVGAIAAAPGATSESTDSDRWQELASALSRCEREGVIAGLVCKERVRLQYCEGAWGAVPQCPAAVASLNTR